MNRNKVLVLGGSIRSQQKNRDRVLRLAERSAGLDAFRTAARALQAEGHLLSNSEILAGAALFGARQAGVEVDYFPLRHLFPAMDGKAFELKGELLDDDTLWHTDTLSIREEAFAELLKALDDSRGVVSLSTPVYFGDRSSVANKFLQMASVRRRVADKVYGVVSVGAKRNGGQETCNVYSLFEMLNHGAFGVGNGMPTSQYGGTAVGGSRGMVTDDEWGLLTAYGTGERVAQVTRIVNAVPQPSVTGSCKIALVVTMDTRERKLEEYVSDLVKQVRATMPGVDFSTISLVGNDIFRCLGCERCPQGPEDGPTHCVIRDPEDYLESVREFLVRADGIVICGLNPKYFEDMVTRYQVFTERMRFMRRSNYELSNKLVASLCYHQFGATINPIHSLKVVTSYIRHNTIIHRPIEIFDHDGTMLNSGLDVLMEFCRAASRISSGTHQVAVQVPHYNPYGEGGGYTRRSATSI